LDQSIITEVLLSSFPGSIAGCQTAPLPVLQFPPGPAVKDFADRFGRMDAAENLHASFAPGAFQNVDQEHAAHQFRPRIVSGPAAAFLLWLVGIRRLFPASVRRGRGPSGNMAIPSSSVGPKSFASAVGMTVSSIWVYDQGDERQITFEGYAQLPSFSADGQKLYYLLRDSGVRQWVTGELWVLDLLTGSRKRVFSNISMAQYNVSADGTRVVFVRTDPPKEGVWIAGFDGRLPPVQVTMEPATRAFFGPAGTVVFQVEEEGQAEYLFRISEDGSSRRKVTAEPIIDVISVSPDRRWAIVWTRGSEDSPSRPMVAYPLDDGDPVRLCEKCANSNGPARGQTPPVVAWSPDGHYLYLSFGIWDGETAYETGKTFVLPLARPNTLPPAFKGEMDVASMSGVQVIPHGGIFPGPRPSLYAYTRATTHRNIYRIPVP
jgi:WD40-like Beta Propeller Repeat